jgi:hypothetical protein
MGDFQKREFQAWSLKNLALASEHKHKFYPELNRDDLNTFGSGSSSEILQNGTEFTMIFSNQNN